MINSKFVKSFGVCASLTLAMLIASAGCGGSSSANGSTGSQGPTAQTAALSAAQGTVSYFGLASELQAAPQAVNAVTGAVGSGKMPGVPALVKLAFKAATAKSLAGNGWQPIQGTSYFDEVTTTTTGGTILFSTDGATNNAGFLTYTQTAPPGTYPTTLGLTFSIGPTVLTVTGTVTSTITDSSGDGTIQGSLASKTIGIAVNLDLTVLGGSVTGTMSVTKNGYTLVYANIAGGGGTIPFTATFSVGAITGTISVNADTSGSATATDATGTWNLTWTSSGATTYTSPTGAVTHGFLL